MQTAGVHAHLELLSPNLCNEENKKGVYSGKFFLSVFHFQRVYKKRKSYEEKYLVVG